MSEKRYRSITLANFEEVPQVRKLPPEIIKTIRIVGSVLPFKSNTYCVDKLIDWGNYQGDPIFNLTFPQKDMLQPEHFSRMEKLLDERASPAEVKKAADDIRHQLNPHPAGQIKYNRPKHHGEYVEGMQHKYRETILFFPTQGQTCHAYCTFCFRWAQFVGMEGLKFATREAEILRDYLEEHPYTTDVLFTGGDPLIMKTKFLDAYVKELLKVKTVRTIRIGTKAIGYWPGRVTTDPDAQDLLTLFKKVADSGRHVSIMAHYNHWIELSTPEAEEAIAAVRATGAQIRTQSPVLKNINDSSDVWAKMWQRQVELGMVPYYFFVARDTGARRYFEVPLSRAWDIYRNAVNRISGLARTVRGPSMSATPGKVQIVGVCEIKGEKAFVLNFYQGRKPEWVGRPFFAKYDPKAVWLSDLKPAFGEKEFFYEKELQQLFKENTGWEPNTMAIPDTQSVSVA